MSLQVEKLENNMAKLTIEVPANDLEKALQSAYMKQKNKIAMPGFRKGKVPRQMIEKMYGPEIFYDDAANALIPKAYSEAYDECDLEIVSRPEINIVQIEKGKSFIFTADVATKPEVKLGEYKGLEVDKVSTRVTQKEVDAKIQEEAEKNAREVVVTDRPVADGDEVILDFEGFVDGEAFEGGKGENYPLTIGSGSFIPGFEEQLVGAEAEKEVEVKVTFPDDYQATDLAGKACQFTITVNSISEQNVPELTDEWVANNSKSSKTVKEYKKEIKKTLEDQKQEDYDSTLKSEAWQAVVDNTTVQKYSKKQQEKIDEMKNSLIDSYKSYAESQGTDYETYITSSGQYTVESFEQKVEEAAQESEKQTMIAEAIADKEKIKLDDKTYKKMLKEYAKTYGFEDGDAMEKAYSKDTLKEAMLTDLVKDWLVDNCIQKTDN